MGQKNRERFVDLLDRGIVRRIIYEPIYLGIYPVLIKMPIISIR